MIEILWYLFLGFYFGLIIGVIVKEEEDNKHFTEYDNFMHEKITILRKLSRELAEKNKQLAEERNYWKNWGVKYLTSYELYSDSFLETLRTIEGEEYVGKLKKEQEEIIRAMNDNGLWE